MAASMRDYMGGAAVQAPWIEALARLYCIVGESEVMDYHQAGAEGWA